MKIIILLSVFIIIFLYACKERCHDAGYCTSKELSWNPHYDGQMLIFENDSSERDTFYVEGSSTFYSIRSTDYPCRDYQSVNSKILINGDYLDIVVNHEISGGEYDSRPCLYTQFTKSPINEFPDSILITIKNRYYSNVRLLIQNPLVRINNVYYSKSFGIISYKLNDGSVWGIVN